MVRVYYVPDKFCIKPAGSNTWTAWKDVYYSSRSRLENLPNINDPNHNLYEVVSSTIGASAVGNGTTEDYQKEFSTVIHNVLVNECGKSTFAMDDTIAFRMRCENHNVTIPSDHTVRTMGVGLAYYPFFHVSADVEWRSPCRVTLYNQDPRVSNSGALAYVDTYSASENKASGGWSQLVDAADPVVSLVRHNVPASDAVDEYLYYTVTLTGATSNREYYHTGEYAGEYPSWNCQYMDPDEWDLWPAKSYHDNYDYSKRTRLCLMEFEIPDLDVSVPDTDVNSYIHVNIGNRCNRPISLSIGRSSNGGLTLQDTYYSATVNQDTVDILCDSDWFTPTSLEVQSIELYLIARDTTSSRTNHIKAGDGQFNAVLSPFNVTYTCPTPGIMSVMAGQSIGINMTGRRGIPSVLSLWCKVPDGSNPYGYDVITSGNTRWMKFHRMNIAKNNPDSFNLLCPGSLFEESRYHRDEDQMDIQIRVERDIGTSDLATFEDTHYTSFSLYVDPLTVTPMPSEVQEGGTVRIALAERRGDTITLNFKYGDILLYTTTTNQDNIDVVCPLSWFTDAGMVGTEGIDITVEATRGTSEVKTTTFRLWDSTLPLSFNVLQESVTTQQDIDFVVTNRAGAILQAQLTSGGTLLYQFDLSTSVGSITCPNSWFETAGFTQGSELPVTFSISDVKGRSASDDFYVIAGSEMRPTVSNVTVSPMQKSDTVTNRFPGLFIRDHTKAKVSANISTVMNAGVSSAIVTWPDGTSFTMNYNNDTGLWEGVSNEYVRQDVRFTVTATDSRGLTNHSTSSIIDVVQYSSPILYINTLYRSDIDGTDWDGGPAFTVQATTIYDTSLPGNYLALFKAGVSGGTMHDIGNNMRHIFEDLPEHNQNYTIVIIAEDALGESVSIERVLYGEAGTYDLPEDDDVEEEEDTETRRRLRLVNSYNAIVGKYRPYNPELQTISSTLTGYPALMEAWYNTIDLENYLTHELLPSISNDSTDAEREVAKLTADALSPVAVAKLEAVTETTASNAALAMARCIVRKSYQVKLIESSFDKNSSLLAVRFSVTNYGDEEDTAESELVSILVTGDMERYIRQKIWTMMERESDDATDVAELFDLDLASFRTMLGKYSLNGLTSLHDACQVCLDILIQQGTGDRANWVGTQNDLYTNIYLPYYAKLAAIEEEIYLRKAELGVVVNVTNKNGDIIQHGMQSYLETVRNQIQRELNFEDYLGEELWQEFASFRREDTYSNSYYISDGLNNRELFKRAAGLLETAQREIIISSTMQHSITASLYNLLCMPEFRSVTRMFEPGNWMRLRVDDKLYRLRLSEFEIDYDSSELPSVVFSDVREGGDSASDIGSLMAQMRSMTTSYGAVERQAQDAVDVRSRMNSWATDGFSLTTKIVNDADNQEFTMDQGGFTGREYIPEEDTYSDEQIKIISNGVYITDDGWETVRVGLGKFKFFNPASAQYETRFGLIADTLVSPLILSEDVGVYNDTNTVKIDQNGITIVADSENNEKVFRIQRKAGNTLEDVIWIDATGNFRLATSTKVGSGNTAKTLADILGGDIAYSQEGVFNALTRNGTLRGLYMDNGALYINADFIKSGTLVLGRADDVNGTLIIRDINDNAVVIGDKNGLQVLKGTIQGCAMIVGGINNDSGTLRVNDADGNQVVLANKDGLWAVAGDVAGFNITRSGLGVGDDFNSVNPPPGGTGFRVFNNGNMSIWDKNLVENQDGTYDGKAHKTDIYNEGIVMYGASANSSTGAFPSGWTDRFSMSVNAIDHSFEYSSQVNGGTIGAPFFTFGLRDPSTSNVTDLISTTASVSVGGDVSVTGTKNRNIQTNSYGRRLLYCYEAASPMFGDIGEGVTDENGECIIDIDDIFGETVPDGLEYQVFLQKEGQGDIWVDSKLDRCFIVKGTPGLRFAWELKAKQRGYETERLEEPVERTGCDSILSPEYLYESELEDFIREQEALLNEAS